MAAAIAPTTKPASVDIHNTYHIGIVGYEPYLKPVDTGGKQPSAPPTVPLTLEILPELAPVMITWSIVSDSTPDVLAASLATRYGLSMAQQLELVETIREQVQKYVSTHLGRQPPVIFEDACVLGKPTIPKLMGLESTNLRNKSSTKRRLSGRPSGLSTKKRKRDTTAAVVVQIDPVYTQEVQRRLIVASRQELQMGRCPLAPTPPLCHVCRRTATHTNACGRMAHTFCDMHRPSTTTDYCFVCTLTCTCESCRPALETLATTLQERCVAQGVPPAQVVWDDLVQLSRNMATRRRPARRNSSLRTVVKKVPATELPREVCNGVDVDPGNATIYATVYLKKSKKKTEDGSMDHCIVCKKAGKISCCDHCPRAFHAACLPEPPAASALASWKCPSCRQEEAPSSSDRLTGLTYATRMAVVCDEYVTAVDDLQLVRTLCMVLEMVVILMDYDFGTLFRQPVDAQAIPDYPLYVKHPMDLGTIVSQMVNGVYLQRHAASAENAAARTVLENTVLDVLKDLHLVWHNCFLFNLEGSAVYRMAQVQQRKASNMAKASLPPMPERVQTGLTNFIRECHQARQAFKASAGPNKPSALPVSWTKPVLKHSIKSSITALPARPVCVLDAGLGRVVQMYTGVAAVVDALSFLMKRPWPCEFAASELDAPVKVQGILQQAATDSRVKLFGYRWIFWDDLERAQNSKASPALGTNGGSTATHKTMVQVDNTWVFGSLTTALAYTGGPPHRWNTSPPQAGAVVQAHGHEWKWLWNHGQVVAQAPDVVCVKRDQLTKRDLVGFTSWEAAHEDWCKCLEAQGDVKVPITKESFMKFYMGKKNSAVSGLLWIRVVRNSTGAPPPQVKTTDQSDAPKYGKPPAASTTKEKEAAKTEDDGKAGGRRHRCRSQRRPSSARLRLQARSRRRR